MAGCSPTSSPRQKRSSLRPHKILLVGDSGVGKTALLLSFTKNKFDDSKTIVFDNYATTVVIENIKIPVCLWDDAGLEDYEKLKPLPYPNTDCFLVCFSLIDRKSFDSVSSKWITYIRHHCPRPRILLVGTKSDLRRAGAKDHVTDEEAEKLRVQMKINHYVQCSARTSFHVKEVFEHAVLAIREADLEISLCTLL